MTHRTPLGAAKRLARRQARFITKAGRIGLRVIGGKAGLITAGVVGVGALLTRDRDGQPRRPSKRINVLNQKALRRALRRVEGFAKFASKSIVLKGTVGLRKKRKPKIHLH